MKLGSGVKPQVHRDRDEWVRVVAAAMVNAAKMQCAGRDELIDAILLVIEQIDE